jgi:hypothetical protein
MWQPGNQVYFQLKSKIKDEKQGFVPGSGSGCRSGSGSGRSADLVESWASCCSSGLESGSSSTIN